METRFKVCLGALAGFALAVAFLYLSFAYVIADWHWTELMFTTWDRGDRIGFLYFALVTMVGFAGVGALLATKP